MTSKYEYPNKSTAITDAVTKATGKRFCPYCRINKPSDEVKRVLSSNKRQYVYCCAACIIVRSTEKRSRVA